MRLLQTPKTKKAPQPHPAKHQNRRTEPHGIKQACHIHTHTHMYLYIYICTYTHTHIYIYIDIAALSRMRQFVFVFVPCLANLVQLPLHRSFRFFFSSSGGPNWPASKRVSSLQSVFKNIFPNPCFAIPDFFVFGKRNINLGTPICFGNPLRERTFF